MWRLVTRLISRRGCIDSAERIDRDYGEYSAPDRGLLPDQVARANADQRTCGAGQRVRNDRARTFEYALVAFGRARRNELERLNKENAALRQRERLLTHRLFGRRSEKGVPVIAQGVLPLAPVAAGPVQPETTDESQRNETSERARLRRRHPGRRRLPADLPRERIEIVPPASARHCSTCDTAKVRIGADITEELDYVPASFVIREYVRPKYACASCQQGVVQPVLPARPIGKGRPGPGLLAHVVTSKYADHLPLYRQEQIFERHGVQITRRTLSEWNGAVADLL